MLKNKRILLILIFVAVIFLIPSICDAAETYTATSTTSTGVTVNWSYELDESGNAVNLICTNKSSITGTVSIPSKLNNHTVVELGSTSSTWREGTFEGCTGLTGVTIPNTITKIGANCFEGCTGLTSITIPNSVTEICDEDVFKECTGLKSITIPDSVTRIGNYAFNGCTGIKTVILGKNISTIGSGAFNNCTGFKEITIPNSVTKIESNAFSGCTGLKSLSIPDNVTTIGTGVFSNCTGITSLKLSESLTKIDKGVFEECDGLTSVIIPSSVTTIAGGYTWDGAFNNCTNLTKVLIPDDVATIEENAFYKCEKLTIYGNDGQASKIYAENNKVKFDYIANWSKVDSGTDIAAPKVKEMEITCNNLYNYYDSNSSTYKIPSNTPITIKVTFNEEITGETAPTLVIKCGAGKDITLTNGEISSPIITYAYTIKSEDIGQIAVKSFNGGNITDLAGNNADLTPTKLIAGYLGNMTAYANGSIVNQNGNANTQTPSSVTLSSIAVTKTPTRSTYLEGEKFDKSGMVITATYSDGSKKEITNYTISPSVALKTTDTKVVISYTENGIIKSVEQKVTVTAKGTNTNIGNSNSTGSSTNNKGNTNKDTTIKNDTKLPQTGVTLLSLTTISLIVVAVISKVRYGKYKDI